MKSFMKLFSLLVVALFLASVPVSASSDRDKEAGKGKDGGKEHRGHDEGDEGHQHGPSTITITANSGGTVSGPTSIPWDGDGVYHLVPDPGCTFVLTVDGAVKGTFSAPVTLELEDVKGPHTIDVLFICEITV